MYNKSITNDPVSLDLLTVVSWHIPFELETFGAILWIRNVKNKNYFSNLQWLYNVALPDVYGRK